MRCDEQDGCPATIKQCLCGVEGVGYAHLPSGTVGSSRYPCFLPRPRYCPMTTFSMQMGLMLRSTFTFSLRMSSASRLTCHMHPYQQLHNQDRHHPQQQPKPYVLITVFTKSATMEATTLKCRYGDWNKTGRLTGGSMAKRDMICSR